MGKEIVSDVKIAPRSDPRPEPILPPAGDERREVLAQRQDQLEEQAEKLADQQEVGAIDPKAFEPDNDIQADLDVLQVTGALPDKKYCWTNGGQHGAYVKRKLAQRWEVVLGDMPEARELINRGSADTTRRLGDTILMRTSIENYKRLRAKDELRRRAREEGVSAKLLELRDKYARTGVGVYTEDDMPENILNTMHKRSQARQMGGKMMDRWMRQGTVPGMPAPKRK